jgi:hypothetical protein
MVRSIIVLTTEGVMMLAMMALPFSLPAFAGPIDCIPKASVQSYEDLGTSGCVLGNFTLSSFTFSAVAASGNSVADLSNVLINILSSNGNANLALYPVPNPTVGDALAIEFGFDIQSNPGRFLDSMQGFRYILDSNGQIVPVNFPPGTKMLVEGCFGAVFAGNACSGAYRSATDSSGLTAPKTMSESSFRISLDAPGNTLGNQVFWGAGVVINGPVVPSPEPASGLLLAIGLLGLRFVFNRRLTTDSTDK